MTTPADTRSTTLERFTGWRESSTSGDAIAAALDAARTTGPAAIRLLSPADQVIVTGAGSSYYLAQAVASVARDVTRRAFSAVPLSELILRPAGVITAGAPATRPVIVISRSGSTSEALTVAERMRALGHPTIAVTCRPASPLAKLADVTLVSPVGDEQGIVMTRSFASMLALLLRLVASVAGDDVLAADLDALPDHWSEATDAAATGARLGATDWSRVVILGGGAAAAIATEWGLKLTETSQVPTLACEPLEFRHGPISVCEPGVLVVGLIGGAGAGDEIRVIEESARLGASTWVLARDRTEAGATHGEVSLIGGGLGATARLPLLLHPAHALAFRLAMTRGRDPDEPRHLGQVVIIDAP
jgi:glucosamine--fructose-6-phosphate aminotransferase (isomerizing)